MIPQFYVKTGMGCEFIEAHAFVFHVVVRDPMLYDYAQENLMRKFRAFIKRERATILRFVIVRDRAASGNVIQLCGLAVRKPLSEEARRRAIQHPSIRGWKP